MANRNAHALLSSSGAHRWLACPPSARLEAQFPDTASESAQEGTFAHEWAELILRNFNREISDEELKAKQELLKSGKSKFGDFYSPSMEEYVDEYTSFVMEKYYDGLERDKGAVLLLEQRLDFSKWVPEGFGRGDALIVADGLLEVIDLKYGRSVQVQAENNPQIRLYALGAYSENAWLYDIKAVRMTIMQPRNGGESCEEMSIKDLLAWGDSIKPIAEQAFEGKGEFHAGEQCRFCRAAVQCKTLATYELEIEKHERKDPNLLTDADISDILMRAEGLTSWLNRIKAYALNEAVDEGHSFPGFKLVEGRSSRKILDTDAAEKILLAADYTSEQIHKPQELLTITGFEKLMGKKRMAELLGPVIDKPPGKPTLVPESDPRPAWNSAQEDFEPIPF